MGIVGGEVLPVLEIIPPDDGWYDMATKYPWLGDGSGTGSQYVCPAELSGAVTEAVKVSWSATIRSMRPVSNPPANAENSTV